MIFFAPSLPFAIFCWWLKFSLRSMLSWSEAELGFWSPGAISEGFLCKWSKQWPAGAHAVCVCVKWGRGFFVCVYKMVTRSLLQDIAASWAWNLGRYWGNLQFTASATHLFFFFFLATHFLTGWFWELEADVAWQGTRQEWQPCWAASLGGGSWQSCGGGWVIEENGSRVARCVRGRGKFKKQPRFLFWENSKVLNTSLCVPSWPSNPSSPIYPLLETFSTLVCMRLMTAGVWSVSGGDCFWLNIMNWSGDSQSAVPWPAALASLRNH